MKNKEIIEDLRSAINTLEEILSKNDLIDSDTYHVINNSRISIDLLEEKPQVIAIVGAGTSLAAGLALLNNSHAHLILENAQRVDLSNQTDYSLSDIEQIELQFNKIEMSDFIPVLDRSKIQSRKSKKPSKGFGNHKEFF